MSGRALAIAGFGGFAILVDGENRAAAFSERLRRVLAHLALHDGPVERRAFAAELWPDDSESHALANLRRRLAELSSSFEALGVTGAVQRSHASVELSPAVRRAVDVVRYLEAACVPSRAAAAAATYAEPIFAGVDDDWLTDARARIRVRHVEMLASLLDHAIESSDLAAIARCADEIATLDPSSEGAVSRAVVALRAGGDEDRARRVFERFLRQSRDQLGIEPAPLSPPRAAGLPPEATPFFGRDAEIDELENSLRHSRIVTLVGPPGVGKSRVAIRAAGLPTRASTVRYVDVSAHADGASVRAELAGVLRTRDPHIGAIAEAAALARALLVFDNAERLVAELCPLLTAITKKGAAVLLTSRVPLRIDGESVVRVEPFDRSTALAFLIARSEAAGGHFERTHERLSAAAAICSELDGLPLALELAARRLPALGFSTLRKRLGERFAALGTSRADGRHDTLLASFEWSYRLLSDDDRRFFRALGMLRAAWKIETAQRVAGVSYTEAADATARLADASLVELGEREGTFATLRTTREYMERLLAESGELAELESRYATTILEGFVSRNDELRGAHAAGAFDALEDAMDDIRAALEIAVAPSGDAGLAARALAALSRFLFERGHAAEARRWCDAVVEHLPPNSPLHGEARYVRALMGRNAGPYDRSLIEFEEAIEALRHDGETLVPAKAMLYAANAARMCGRAERALELAEGARSTLERAGDPYLAAFARSAVGTALYTSGDLAAAKREFESAARAFAALEAYGDEALMLVDAARCDFGRGDRVSVKSAYVKALAYAHETGNRYVEAHARIGFALLALDCGEPAAQIRSHLAIAAAIALDTGDLELSAIALDGVSELFAAEGDPERAVVAIATGDQVRAAYTLARPPTDRARSAALRERIGALPPARPSARAESTMRSLLASLTGGFYALTTARRR